MSDQISHAVGLVIAFQGSSPDRNIWYVMVRHREPHTASASLCPAVSCGGRKAYVLSREQAETLLNDTKVAAIDREEIRRYFDNNIDACEGLVDVDVWLDGTQIDEESIRTIAFKIGLSGYLRQIGDYPQ